MSDESLLGASPEDIATMLACGDLTPSDVMHMCEELLRELAEDFADYADKFEDAEKREVVLVIDGQPATAVVFNEVVKGLTEITGALNAILSCDDYEEATHLEGLKQRVKVLMPSAQDRAAMRFSTPVLTAAIKRVTT